MQSNRKWILGGAVVALGILGAAWLHNANAADLGGDCCADLEERIAELEATVARKGNRKVSLTVSGEINKAIYWYDAKDLGLGSNAAVIENGASESRITLQGEAEIRPGLKAGYVLQLGQGETGVHADLLAPGLGLGIQTNNDFYTRQSFAYIGSKEYGTVSFGLQSMATDDLSQQNVANTGVSSKRMTWQPIGGIAVSIGPVDLLSLHIEPFNGRKADSVKYTSPTISGFSVSAAWDAGDDSWDVALKYAFLGNGFDVVAAVGYYDDKTNDIVEQIGLPIDISSTTLTVNAGVKHVGSGLFAQGTWARLDIDAPGFGVDTDSWHVQAGIERKWLDIGETTLFAEYSDWSDLELTFYGVGITQNLGGEVDVYALARRYEIDLGPGGEIDSVMGGARIKF